MNVNQLAGEAPAAAPVAAPAPNVTVRQGVTPDGIPYTVEVSGTDPVATQQTISSVNSIAQTVVAAPTPVTIDRSEVLRNIPRRDTPERIHYRNLKQLVWGKLRWDLRQLETLQRNLKTALKLRAWGRVGCRYLLNALDTNRVELRFRYGLMTYLRKGHKEGWSDDYAEDFFHSLYHRDSTFRRHFWEFYNLKHNPETHQEEPAEAEETEGTVALDEELDLPPGVVVAPVEEPPPQQVSPTAAPASTPVTAEDSGEVVRCEACGSPVSQISRCCTHCGMRY